MDWLRPEGMGCSHTPGVQGLDEVRWGVSWFNSGVAYFRMLRS